MADSDVEGSDTHGEGWKRETANIEEKGTGRLTHNERSGGSRSRITSKSFRV